MKQLTKITIGLLVSILLVVGFGGCRSVTTHSVTSTTTTSSSPSILTVLPLASVFSSAEVGNNYVGSFLDQHLQLNYIFYVQYPDGGISLRLLGATEVIILQDGFTKLDEYSSPQVASHQGTDIYYYLYVLHIPAGSIINNFTVMVTGDNRIYGYTQNIY